MSGGRGRKKSCCRRAARSKLKRGWNSLLKTLVNRNPDLKALLEKGYALALDTNYLIVRDIPYLNVAGELKWGALAAKLVFEDDVIVRPEDHQVFWSALRPYGLDGQLICGLGDRKSTRRNSST